MRCTVVGAGVSGLSCAVRLLEAGHEVEVISDRFSPDTVSDVAAAIWYPFLTAPADRADGWGVATYAELERLAEQESDSGVRMRDGKEYLREAVDPPEWSEDIAAFRILDDNEIPEGYVFGWQFRAPVIEMPLYMPWLRSRVEALGGSFVQSFVEDLNEVSGEVVVNCVGLGARELCDDEDVRPARGQIIFIDQDPGIGHFDQTPETLTYTIPRSDVTVLGGTAQIDDWGMDIRPEDYDLILSKVEALWPQLDRSKIVGEAVGLRPSRSEVRLEVEYIGEKKVVHNYGHGGAGVTLSWGCAEEVANLVSQSA
ncbi:MAG: FAD-dependent oxidoreductase [Candidatus Thalassarchaeaceae archaeon]|nr:FAD-dependent oxidoreductase [Candidatus Thalassarchaeaceae archaeon]